MLSLLPHFGALCNLAILVLIMVAVICSGSVVAIVGGLLNRIKQVEGRREDASDLAEISRQLDAVRDQIFSVEDEMTRLTERVDFTEKLLEAPRARPDKDEP